LLDFYVVEHPIAVVLILSFNPEPNPRLLPNMDKGPMGSRMYLAKVVMELPTSSMFEIG